MKPNETNTMMEKIMKGLGQVKAALTKDYSWQDIKTWMSNRSARASTVDSVSTASAVNMNSVAGSVGSSFASVANLPQVLAAAAGRHYMLLIALVCIALFAIASQLWLLPLTKTMQATLELRPVQWAQLQHVLKVNHAISAPGVGGSAMGVGGLSVIRATLVTALDEAEMQKVRAVLAARDIKPNVLRLSNDNPPRLEIQANEVLFSAWIEVLDELRQVWRLYPESVSAIASANPGIVQISSTLKQAQMPVQVQPQLQLNSRAP